MIKFYLFLFVTFLVGASFASNSMDELAGTSSHLDGPNCWNGALVVSGVLKSKRFITPKEWLYHLENNCEEIKRPFPGAVGRIFHPDNGEVHGFIHLSHDYIFAKHGEDSAHGYQYMSYQEMLDQYGRTRSCRTSDDFSKECMHKVVYYSCQGQAQIPSELLQVNRLLEELAFSELTDKSYKENCKSGSFIERERILDEIIGTLNIYRENTNIRNIELEKVLYRSYRQQLYNLQVSNRNYRCENRKIKKEKIKVLRNLLKDLFTH